MKLCVQHRISDIYIANNEKIHKTIDSIFQDMLLLLVVVVVMKLCVNPIVIPDPPLVNVK